MKAEKSNTADWACDGQQIFALGRFWPVAFIDLDRCGGLALIPDHLWLIEQDRVMVALGDMPTIPATVAKLEHDLVQLQFSQPLHKSVLESTGYCAHVGPDEDVRIAA